MSEIDRIQHSYLGHLTEYALVHPLDELKLKNFDLDIHCLALISNNKPFLKIKDLDKCVLKYLEILFKEHKRISAGYYSFSEYYTSESENSEENNLGSVVNFKDYQKILY
jgi:hypothetical protein